MKEKENVLLQAMKVHVVLVSYDRKGECKPYILLLDSNTDEKLSLPGGFLEESDKSIEDSIARTLLQQTGLELKPDYFNLCYLNNDNVDISKYRIANAGYYMIIDTLATPTTGAKWYALNELVSGSFNKEEAETISAALKQLAINAKRVFHIINPKLGSEAEKQLSSQSRCFEDLYAAFGKTLEYGLDSDTEFEKSIKRK